MTGPSNADAAIALLLGAADPSRPAALNGKVLGLIGYGLVGREIARRAAHHGMKVIYMDDSPGRGPHERVQLVELLRRSDFVMPVHAHAQTFNRTEVTALMKPGARLLEL